MNEYGIKSESASIADIGLKNVANVVKRKINDQVGKEIIVEAHSPSFGFEQSLQESEMIVKKINDSDANVLVVGLGTPKQEKWIFQNRSKLLKINLFMGVGATLDFIAGTQKRAPLWIQKIGFEWAYRLLQEPRRLFKRYFTTNAVFAYLLVKEMFRGSK